MAGSGAKVMQSRAVEFAKKFGVEFEVRSSFTKRRGTVAKEETPSMEDVVVRGSASTDTRQNSASQACATSREWLPGFFRTSLQRTSSST